MQKPARATDNENESSLHECSRVIENKAIFTL